MEEKNLQNSCCDKGVCQSCQKCQRHRVIRWILGVVILTAVFSFGFKMGEFSSWMRSGDGNYGYYMMRNGLSGYNGGNGYWGYPGPGMMYGWYGNQGSTSTLFQYPYR